VNPNFVYDIQESEPSPDGSIHSSDNLNETIEPKEETKEESKEEPKPELEPELKEEPKTLLKIKKNNKTYFVYKEDDPEQDVYEYNEEKRTDKIIGKRTRLNGKWSWKLY